MNKRDIQLPLRLLAVVQRHTISDPITVPQLAAMFGIGEREVKSCLTELVDAGHKVCSNKSKPMGVFVARYPSEAYETAQRLHREGVKYLSRSKKLMTWEGPQPEVFEQPLPDTQEAA